MTALDAIFKAYDIRGTVPDQLDDEHVPRHRVGLRPLRRRRRGSSSAATCGRRARSSSAAFADGVTRAGRRRRRPRAGLDRPRVLRRRPLRRAGRDVHRLAQPGPVQRHQAVPRRGPAGRRRHRAGRDPGDGRGRARRRRSGAGRDGRAPSAVDLLDAFADHVVSFVDLSLLKPLKVVADTANGMGGLVVPDGLRAPARSTSRSCTASSTARSRTTRPTRSSRPTSATCRPGCVAGGADVGLAFDGDADRVFLVDETGPRPVRARPPRPSSPPACSAREPGRDHPAQPDLLAGRARGHPRARRRAGAHHASATRSSSR